MAKGKYNPAAIFKEDPLAALRAATDDAKESKTLDVQPVLIDSSPDAKPIEVPEDVMSRNRGIAKTSRAATKPLAASLSTSRNTVYLYPEDLTKLRQLSGYVSTEHGIRANDSMIFRAALSLLEPDARLLHALRETELLDRRRRKTE